MRVNFMSDEALENSGPIVIKSSGEKKDKIVLFTIDDQDFTVPAKPGMRVALKFLNQMKKSDNEMFGMLQLLEDMLGEEQYNKLLDYEELSDDLVGKIAEQCITLALGNAQETTGK
jgi:hypothetical protein